MKYLYAPWRSPYSSGVHKTKHEKATEKDCVFCLQFKEKNDAEHFILKRTKYNAIMLNKFPYNAGHLLIMPLGHHASLDKLSKPARTELMELVAKTTQLLEKELTADGINIGLNLGKAAGAGIPSHLHFHVLPRWHGDTNFLPTLTDTKQISFDLRNIYEQLKKKFK
jgi:ATP adenylyltransferase